jgi:hypothetical protein
VSFNVYGNVFVMPAGREEESLNELARFELSFFQIAFGVRKTLELVRATVKPQIGIFGGISKLTQPIPCQQSLMKSKQRTERRNCVAPLRTLHACSPICSGRENFPQIAFCLAAFSCPLGTTRLRTII